MQAMNETFDTVFAPSSAVGGAVVVIRVSGRDARAVADAVLNVRLKTPNLLRHAKIVKNGETVRVTSRRGSITAAARVGRKVSEGETWMPFHFPDSPVNRLTNAALDEFARIPEFKVCAVRVEKAEEA